jgi:DNA-binding MarR family transcriptional regulator
MNSAVEKTPPRTREEEPVDQVGPAFKAAMASVRRLRGRERRSPGELRDAQYSLLFSLCQRDHLSSSELAHLADLTPASATELLDEMEQHGLVQRTRSAQDRRVVQVALTDRGLGLVQQRRERLEPRWRSAFADFSDDELRAAVAVLERMRDFFDQMAAER